MSALNPVHPVLLVDDDEAILSTLRITLALAGITNIICCTGSAAALQAARETEIEAVLLDILMPGSKGNETLPELLAIQPDLPVIMVSGIDDIDIAIECMHHGAYDFIRKPADAERIVGTLNRALDLRATRRERRALSEKFLQPAPARPAAFAHIITRSPIMLRIFQYCEAVAPSPEPVIITGETGVGKELLAQAIHAASGRTGPFVAVNVAGLDDQAFSDSLFGHVRGAFTGADRARAGMIERAAGGTLFLDEIGDLPPSAQIRLLRVLQEREYHPLGADSPRPLTARILTATNRPLPELSADSAFRKDFFFRIATHSLALPPLRERPEDIPLLIEHFRDQATQSLGSTPDFPAEWTASLCSRPFPGNVRELRGLIFDLACGAPLPAAPGPDDPHPAVLSEADTAGLFAACPVLPALQNATEALVDEALRRSAGHQRRAAHLLGISPQALSARLKRRDKDINKR